jgi:hypothetical protein
MGKDEDKPPEVESTFEGLRSHLTFMPHPRDRKPVVTEKELMMQRESLDRIGKALQRLMRSKNPPKTLEEFQQRLRKNVAIARGKKKAVPPKNLTYVPKRPEEK